MPGEIEYYFSSVSGSKEIKKKQERIELVLSGKRISFEKIDISLVEGAKEKMREIVGDPTALPPQLCKGDVYLGSFAQFEEAIENEALDSFLQISN